VEFLYSGEPCTDCDEELEWCQLGFDHLDRDLKENSPSFKASSQATEANWLALSQELSKCEIVCHNCHALRTRDQNQEITAALDRQAEAYMIMIEGRE
jgi:cytochrome c553